MRCAIRIFLAMGTALVAGTAWAQQPAPAAFLGMPPALPSPSAQVRPLPAVTLQGTANATTQAANPFAGAQGYRTSTAATMNGNLSSAAGKPLAKPFADYTPPPTVSPYMNLFRNGANGTDNYYSLVKPALDQGKYNQQMQKQIETLQTNSSIQSQQLNRLNPADRPGNLTPGASLQGSFMNLQNYYPGMPSLGQ